MKNPTQLTLQVQERETKWTINTTAIEQARILSGLSYQELAHKARIDRATLSDFVNGRRQPTLGTVHRVIRCLDIEPKDVFVFADHSANRAA